MKVCLLSTVHRVRDIRIFYKECRTLAAAGYEVTLVARGDKDFFEDGVNVRVLPTVKGRLKRMFVLPWKALGMARRSGAKLVHFHDPELLPMGILLKLMGRKVIYDSHENLRQDILHSKDYIPRLLRKPLSFIVGSFESFAVLFFDGVVCASDGIAERFPSRKSVAVRNYPILTDLPPSQPYGERPPIAVFTGGLTRTRCAAEMVEASKLLQGIEGFQLVVAGSVAPGCLCPDTRTLDYRGLLARQEVEELLAQARVGLLLNYPREDYQDISSNKLYEYMLAGLPVVTASIPSWKKTIEETGCGIVVDPLDPDDIARAVRHLIENPKEAKEMGKRGQETARKHFTWDSEAVKLLRMYQRLSGESGR